MQILSTGGNPLPAAATRGYDEPTVQLMLRGAPGDPTTPLARAWSAYAALQGLRYVTLDEGGEDEVFLIVAPRRRRRPRTPAPTRRAATASRSTSPCTSGR